MGKSWFKNASFPKASPGTLGQRRQRFGAGMRWLKRRARLWWCLHAKVPFYRLVAHRWPNSKIGRKHLCEQQREEVHHRVASAVGKPSSAYDLMLFSIMDWHSRTQRPQQLCREFARMGHRVFYVESTIHSMPHADWTQRGYGFVDSPQSNVFLCQLHCDLPRPRVYGAMMSGPYREEFSRGIHNLRQNHQIRHLVSMVQNPFWRPLVETLPGSFLVYDCLDYHAGFATGTPEADDEERCLLKAADLVLTSSASLAEKIGKVAPNVLVRNAAEFDLFSRKPITIKRPSSRPVIGYYGAIADWFDMELVRTAAEAFPQWDFWLIGATSKQNLAAARKTPNIRFAGEVPYSELPAYLYGMDVCMIPFQENELTRCTNPVKIYEYLAAGKPVVTTWMPELELMREHVQVARSRAEFLASLQRAMDNPGTPEQTRKRIEWAASQDWSVRARQIDAEVRQRFPPASIIVLTHNNLALTQACLASLIQFTDYPNYELILVDNASSDGSVQFLKEFAGRHKHVRLVLSERNAGFATGNNLGIKMARGDYIVLLNNDTFCTQGWLLGLLRHLIKNEDLGAVGPVTNNIGNEAKVDLTYSGMSELAVVAWKYTTAHARALLEARTIAFFCVAFKRSAIEKVGCLDESFGLGFFEDDDYCNRIRHLGLRICIAEDVFIHHELSASFSQLASTDRAQLFQDNLKRYEAKWGKWRPHQYREQTTQP